MKQRKQKIEACALVYADGTWVMADRVIWTSLPHRRVKLVPHSPTADAVVRAAIRAVKDDIGQKTADALYRAVERHERAMRKKK